MAKVIEFYLRGPFPKKVNPVPIEQRGKLVEFSKENFAAPSKTNDHTEHGEVSPSASRSCRQGAIWRGILHHSCQFSLDGAPLHRAHSAIASERS